MTLKKPPGAEYYAYNLGPTREILIKVGEEYNNREDDFTWYHDHWSQDLENKIAQQGAIIFKNYPDKVFGLEGKTAYPWPGVYIRAPPEGFFYLIAGAYNGGSINFRYLKPKLECNGFTFSQIWKERYAQPQKDTTNLGDLIRELRYFFIFGADRGSDNTYRWLDSAKLVRQEWLIFSGPPYGKLLAEDTLSMPIDSVANYMIEKNKLRIEFLADRKTIIIWDENPKYKTIARDGYIKYNNIYIPKDTVKAKLLYSIPADGETGVATNTFITMKFSEPLVYELTKGMVLEEGYYKEGNFTLTNDDSVLVWWGKDLFKANARVEWTFEVYDRDTNQTVVSGHFYTVNPAGVEEEAKEEGPAVVIDVLGRVVRRYEVGEAIDPEQKGLPSGVYIIIQTTGQQKKIRKIYKM